MTLDKHKLGEYESSVKALPDRPSDAGITAQALKELFDSRTDNEVKQKHNSLIDELIAAGVEGLSAHIADKNNPHSVTKAQVALGNVDNTSDLAKPLSTAAQSALAQKAEQAVVSSLSVAVSAKADQASVVDLSSNQMIRGEKQFETAPLLPGAPQSANSAVNKAYVDSLSQAGTGSSGFVRAYLESGTSSQARRVVIGGIESLDDILHKVIAIQTEHAGSGINSSTLNVNDYGAKPIIFPVVGGSGFSETPINENWVHAGGVYQVMWNGEAFALLSANYRDATTSDAGIVKLSNSCSTYSAVTAATTTAVKTVYDIAQGAVPSAEKGVAGGIATLGSDGLVPAAQLPQSSSSAFSPYSVYTCSGAADSSAIAAIVNDFFNNGTALIMKLVISGAMGLEFGDNGCAMTIDASNTRGAVCYLDFSYCHIPDITAANKDFMCISGSKVRLNVTDLVVTASRYALYLEACSSGVFSNCTFNGGVYGVSLPSVFEGICTFNSCKIIGSIYALCGAAANNNAVCKIINCSTKSGASTDYDIYQSAPTNTMVWFIIGCNFASSSIFLNGAVKGFSSSTANNYLYVPAYSNQYGRDAI